MLTRKRSSWKGHTPFVKLLVFFKEAKSNEIANWSLLSIVFWWVFRVKF